MKNGLVAAILLAIFLIGPPNEAAADKTDEEFIKATALDYIEGWYEGNGERMGRALHPELAKRAVFVTPAGEHNLRHMTKKDLVDATNAGYGKQTPEDQRRSDVKILDRYGNTAVVKVVVVEWIDYLQLMKWEGRWVIINVLWEPTPEAKKKWGLKE